MNRESTKGAIAPWLLMVFIIVLLGGGGYLVWYFYGSKSGTTTATTTPTALTSAKKVSPSPTTTTSATVTSDTSLLIKLCESNNSGMTCEVNNIDGNYAIGTAAYVDKGVGGHWYAKKVNGTWTMVVNGAQDTPSCSKTSDFPKSLVPTCSQ